MKNNHYTLPTCHRKEIKQYGKPVTAKVQSLPVKDEIGENVTKCRGFPAL